MLCIGYSNVLWLAWYIVNQREIKYSQTYFNDQLTNYLYHVTMIFISLHNAFHFN